MDIGCITRCISLAVFAASLQAFAQPPDGKGKPAHAGASPFIRFPVPQQSVGVVRQSQPVAAPQVKAPQPAGNAFGKSPNATLVVGGNAFGKTANPSLVAGGNAFGRSVNAAPVLATAPAVSVAPAVSAAPSGTAAPVAPGGFELKTVKLAEPVVSAAPAADSDSSAGETRAPLPECGAR